MSINAHAERLGQLRRKRGELLDQLHTLTRQLCELDADLEPSEMRPLLYNIDQQCGVIRRQILGVTAELDHLQPSN